MAVLVEHDLGDFRRCKRIDHEIGGVGGPWDDVDLLPLELVDHGLHARTAHADASTDRINRRIAGNHRYFRARAWVARDRLYLDDPVINLRHFLCEQFGHELRVSGWEKYLRPPRLAAHVVDEGADPFAVADG